MQKVKCYVDTMFQELPNSKRATELKTEILANMEERYRELAEYNKEPCEIEDQLIAEIGTASEIRENINLTSKNRRIVAITLQLIIIFAAGSFIRYVNLYDNEDTFNIIPRIVATGVAYPAVIFFTTLLILNVLNYFIRPKQIFLRKKLFRIISFAISIALLCLYGLFALHALGFLVTLSWNLFSFMVRNLNIIAVVTGILFYLGSRK